MGSLARILVERRVPVLVLLALITAFFIFACRNLSVVTRFDDLLPQQHPFIQVHNKIRSVFGGAQQVIIMVEVRHGDIFNTETLEKVVWITRELESIPGVDPNKIRSIAVSKFKDFIFSSGTLSIRPLMFPDVPAAGPEMQRLRDSIYSNPRYYGQYVSLDSRKALIQVDFFEQELDYTAVFQELMRIRARTEDDNHIINIAGEPVHLGYIRDQAAQIVVILGLTVVIMLLMLFMYYRCWRATLVPMLAAACSACWGLGFMALLDFALDPLMLVLPFLIALIAARHAMQCISRYLEQYALVEDTVAAARATLAVMLRPGATSIVTDALGIALTAIAMIPILVNLAVTCAFWAVATIIVSVVLTPLVLACLPGSARLRMYAGRTTYSSKRALRKKLLALIARITTGRGKWWVATCALLLVLIGQHYARHLQVGEFMPGSSVLWPDHRYNQDAFRIAGSIPILNPLYVVAEGSEGGFVTRGQTLRAIDRFQRHVQQHERVMFTYSLVNSLPGFLMASYEDDPQWCHLPRQDRVLSFIARRLIYAAEPGAWDQYIDMQDRFANIVIYCRDKSPRTVEAVMDHIKGYLAETPGPPGGRFLLAGGSVGVQAAVREVIADAQVWNVLFALGGICVFCTFLFRSIAAGMILTIPLAISNIITFALMGAYQVGLTVATYPVASVGIGLGVDYGIYFVSRVQEERNRGLAPVAALHEALATNGRAIIQIATTITIGLGIWLFSPIRFQAEMGALLAALLFLNMMGALLLVPSLICILKPKFIYGGAEHACNETDPTS